MTVSRQSLINWWVRWAAPLIIVLVCLFSIFLAFRRHAAFQTNFYDLGSYAQVVWNLSHGSGFTTSLGPTNYLTNHFSLLLLILAPFFSVWPDARVLIVAEPIALTTSIIPVYLIVRGGYPRLAPLLVLACAFSPLLHQFELAQAQANGAFEPVANRVYAADRLEPSAPANGHTLAVLSTVNQAP